MSQLSSYKQQLRSQIQDHLNCLPENFLIEKSNRVIQMLLTHPKIIQSQTIACYWPLPKEVNLIPFIQHFYTTKNILLPLIVNNHLIFKRFLGSCNLKQGKYGIFEPNTNNWFEKQFIEVIIVPGMAFDKENHRMGRGKGYYDKYLFNCSAYKIGVCFDFQLLPNIPSNHYDVKMDEVICA